MSQMCRREMLKRAAAVFAMSRCSTALAAEGENASGPKPEMLAKAISSGRDFLISLFDPELDLLPEYREANVYWLFHDNYLAAKVLDKSHPKIAGRIRLAFDRERIHQSGKIETLFGEAKDPLPFRKYELKDVRQAGKKVIRTEVVTVDPFEGWSQYADLLLLASIAERDDQASLKHWNDTFQMWDGKGFWDAAAKHFEMYATYKLGLALIAAKRHPKARLPDRLVETLLRNQDATGGWITDYDASGKKIGLANVETTCFCILGLESVPAISASGIDKTQFNK